MLTKDTPQSCTATTTSPSGIVWVCGKDDCYGGHYYRPTAA